MVESSTSDMVHGDKGVLKEKSFEDLSVQGCMICEKPEQSLSMLDPR